MSSGIYLIDHPPATRQFRSPRRAQVTGLIVVHTAEGVMDTVGPDTGAENVADFIRRRADYGSYHTLVDSDSRVRLVAFNAEAYGDGTGSNLFAIHISFACKTSDWARMSAERRDAFLRQGAKAAAEASNYVKQQRGFHVPARRVSRADSDRGAAGFISHGERDPGRRSDPGKDFPWARFFELYEEELNPMPAKPKKVENHVTRGRGHQADMEGYIGKAVESGLAAIREYTSVRGRPAVRSILLAPVRTIVIALRGFRATSFAARKRGPRT